MENLFKVNSPKNSVSSTEKCNLRKFLLNICAVKFHISVKLVFKDKAKSSFSAKTVCLYMQIRYYLI